MNIIDTRKEHKAKVDEFILLKKNFDAMKFTTRNSKFWKENTKVDNAFEKLKEAKNNQIYAEILFRTKGCTE